MRTSLTIKVNSKQMAGLRQLANTKDKSVSAILREMVNDLLKRNGLQPVSK